MMGLTFSRGAWVGLLLVLFFALVLLLPLRLALGMAGLERLGLSARDVRGSMWSGRIDTLMISDVPLGSVRVGLSPLHLFKGRLRIDMERAKGLPDDISGGIGTGIGGFGLDDVTGAVPLGSALAPLPIGSLRMDKVSVRFSGGRCVSAEGNVHASITGRIEGLNLSQGLSGALRCDGEALLIPLVSQSAMETLNLRFTENGRYTAEMRVQTGDAALAAALGATGFRSAGGAQLLSIAGSL